ncbi:MAG: hypothetical protein Q4E55_04590, partial [Bacteroidales bacterium]|nr:hypothetical protein [Bacteroidales bacterium]
KPATTSESMRFSNSKEVVFVVDGKIVPYSEIQSLSPSTIKSMSVVKDMESAEIQKYVKEYKKTSSVDPKCFIVIETK